MLYRFEIKIINTYLEKVEMLYIYCKPWSFYLLMKL